MSMETEKFAVFILTHGRPHKVKTYETLRKQGYTGQIYIIIDNEDKTAAEYYKRFGDQVIMFDKEAVAQQIDEGDNFKDRRAIIYARNASYQIAQDLGLDYFLQLDDDYTSFVHKFTADLVYREKPVKNLDRLFALMLDFYKSTSAVTVALGQNGDFQGGSQNGDLTRLWLKRKAMNTFFCSPHRPHKFFGRINEDVNTYVTQGNRGDLILTVFNAAIIQSQTQHTTGGMTELYLNMGTYVKSFYTVMYSPACVKIAEFGNDHARLHHRINWNAAVPKIMSEQYRKLPRLIQNGTP